MTKEEKQLLLIDLCGRLPYRVRINRERIVGSYVSIDFNLSLETFDKLKVGIQDDKFLIRPYLRPMSSMTEEECKILGSISATLENKLIEVLPNTPYYIEVAVPDQIDWLNEHHFDYRGLIEKSLAIVAPEDMY